MPSLESNATVLGMGDQDLVQNTNINSNPGQAFINQYKLIYARLKGWNISSSVKPAILPRYASNFVEAYRGNVAGFIGS